MIYLLTAIGLPHGSSSTVHIYTQTIHRKTQNKQYMEQHKNFGRVRAVPRLCGLYPGICITTYEKAWETLSQGSRRLPAGTMIQAPCSENYAPEDNMEKYFPSFPYLKIAEYKKLCDGR